MAIYLPAVPQIDTEISYHAISIKQQKQHISDSSEVKLTVYFICQN